MKIAIKNPAPVGDVGKKWGDYVFAQSLAKSLENLGHEVVHHFWPNWSDDDGEDVVLVLRGKRKHVPNPEKTNLIWIISHMVTVSDVELSQYDHVFSCSEKLLDLMRGGIKTPSSLMRQCTDTSIFNSRNDDFEKRRGVYFVANSRGVKRDIVDWAQKSELDFKLIGRHWAGMNMKKWVVSEYIENSELPEFYRAARLGLNDHWGDMSYFGAINNRVFDSLACGLPIISDDFPELRKVCGDGILYAHDLNSFSKAYQKYMFDYERIYENGVALWQKIKSEYTFESRAEQISDVIASCVKNRLPGTGNIVVPKNEKPKKFDFLKDFNKKSLNLLHIFPSPELTFEFFSEEAISYLSAGFGAGPWHVNLFEDLSNIKDKNFDVIVLEDDGLGNNRLTVESLKNKLQNNGKLYFVEK